MGSVQIFSSFFYDSFGITASIAANVACFQVGTITVIESHILALK